MTIKPGQIWRETKDQRRYIVILQAEVYGTGPAWAYCNKRGVPVPDTKDETNWHYCDAYDFYVWKRFGLVREVKP